MTDRVLVKGSSVDSGLQLSGRNFIVIYCLRNLKDRLPKAKHERKFE